MRRDNRLAVLGAQTTPMQRQRPESNSNRYKLRANAIATHEVVISPARSKSVFDVGGIGESSRRRSAKHERSTICDKSDRHLQKHRIGEC
jgi:hypothetical protein